jgi:hypothetical protein
MSDLRVDWFRQLHTKRQAQVRVTLWRWQGIGLKTWPANRNGRQKRALHFGIGYWSWVIAPARLS